MAAEEYPTWSYYPPSEAPPTWAYEFIGAVRSVKGDIESRSINSLKSDVVLSHLTAALQLLGYEVEAGKGLRDKIRRPVLFGLNGRGRVTYEVDAFHPEHGIVVEVEAGRGARGNAIYRDLIRASLIVGAKYLILGVMLEYRHQSSGKTMRVRSFDEAREQMDAIYASGRLKLPFEGLLLFGY